MSKIRLAHIVLAQRAVLQTCYSRTFVLELLYCTIWIEKWYQKIYLEYLFSSFTLTLFPENTRENNIINVDIKLIVQVPYKSGWTPCKLERDQWFQSTVEPPNSELHNSGKLHISGQLSIDQVFDFSLLNLQNSGKCKCNFDELLLILLLRPLLKQA